MVSSKRLVEPRWRRVWLCGVERECSLRVTVCCFGLDGVGGRVGARISLLEPRKKSDTCVFQKLNPLLNRFFVVPSLAAGSPPPYPLAHRPCSRFPCVLHQVADKDCTAVSMYGMILIVITTSARVLYGHQMLAHSPIKR